jgi:hypothetical protein
MLTRASGFRAVLVLLCLFAGAAVGHAPASAQPGCIICDPGQADPPLVTVWPADSSFAWTDSLVAVTINWFSGDALASNTREILLNGINVTGQFTYSGGTQSAESYGTVRLVAGLNQFSARICDLGSTVVGNVWAQVGLGT